MRSIGSRVFSGRPWLPLAIILTVGLLLRVAFAYHVRGRPLFGDGALYDYYGRALLDGSYPEEYGQFRSMLPVGYPGFVAGVYALFGRSNYDAIRYVQALLAVGALGVIYLIGRDLWDRRVGLIAATLFAVYPFAVFYPATLMSETIYLLLTLTTVWLVVRLRRKPNARLALAAGLTAGVAVLTRPQYVLFVAIASAWLLYYGEANLRRRAAVVTVMVAATFAPVLPWTARNWSHYGEFVLVSDNGTDAWWWGNNHFSARMTLTSDRQEFERLNVLVWGDEGERVLRRRGRTLAQKRADVNREVNAYIRGNTSEWLHFELEKLVAYWRPWLGGRNNSSESIISLASYGPMLFIGLPFLLYEARRRGPRRPEAHLFLVQFGVFTIVFVLFVAMSRYRFPVADPYLALFTSAASLTAWERWRARRRSTGTVQAEAT